MLLWNTVDRSRQRIARSSFSSSSSRLRPSKTISPLLTRAGARRSCSRAVPSVDLPDPDSPIRPTNSPSETVKLTSSTAVSAGFSFGSYRTVRF